MHFLQLNWLYLDIWLFKVALFRVRWIGVELILSFLISVGADGVLAPKIRHSCQKLYFAKSSSFTWKVIGLAQYYLFGTYHILNSDWRPWYDFQGVNKIGPPSKKIIIVFGNCFLFTPWCPPTSSVYKSYLQVKMDLVLYPWT